LVACLFEDVRDDIESFLCTDAIRDFVLVVFDDLVFVLHKFVEQIECDALFVVHVFVVGRDQLAYFAEVIGGQLLQPGFVCADDFGVQLTGDQLVLQVLDDRRDETVEAVQDGNVFVAHQQQEPVADALQRDDQLSGFLFQVTDILVDLTQRNLVQLEVVVQRLDFRIHVVFQGEYKVAPLFPIFDFFFVGWLLQSY